MVVCGVKHIAQNAELRNYPLNYHLPSGWTDAQILFQSRLARLVGRIDQLDLFRPMVLSA